MKKNYQNTFIFFVLVLSSFSLSAQTQYDYEHALVCWDSAGVETTLIAKLFYVVGSPSEVVSKVYIHPVTNAVVVPTVGTISPEVCGAKSRIDTVIVKLDSLLDEMTQDPDTCNCLYTIDFENHAFSIEDNSKFIVWTADEVITRNCGYGTEEVSRQPHVQQQTGKTYELYDNNEPTGTFLDDDLGFIDSFRVHTINPVGNFAIDLNPSTVLTTYPDLLNFYPSFDSTDLIFDAQATTDMETAITNVVEHAFLVYSTSNNLTIPANDLFVDVKTTGQFILGFSITHNPTGHYANIDFSQSNSTIVYSPDGTARTNSIQELTNFSLSYIFDSYQTSCGVIFTQYFQLTQDVVNTDFDTIVLDTPSPTLSGSIGSRTCTEACVSIDDGCVSICDTVIVQVAEAECLTQNEFSHKYVDAANQKSFTANTINSLSVKVLSGILTIGLPNSDGTIEYLPYSNGETFTLTADECKYILSDISVNSSLGTGRLLWKY